MGVWSPDVMGSDAAIEFAMDLLTAAGIGPKPRWPPKSMTVSLLPVPGKGPIVVRHNPEQMDACMQAMDAAIDAYEPIEAAMSELIKLCNDKQTLIDKHTFGPNSGQDQPVGHALQVLAVLVMQAGACLPQPLKDFVLDVNKNDPYASRTNDPLRKLVIAEFDKLVREYKVTEPDGGVCFEATRILYKQYPNPMVWGGPPEVDSVWATAITKQFAEDCKVERRVLTRAPPKAALPELYVELSMGSVDESETVTMEHGDFTGKKVKLRGLRARPDLNDLIGDAGEYFPAKGRYRVKLPEGSTPELLDSLSVKVANLELV
eukprot:scaffold7779_cov62-Phaeocystis_antarctica.AAC.7